MRWGRSPFALALAACSGSAHDPSGEVDSQPSPAPAPIPTAASKGTFFPEPAASKLPACTAGVTTVCTLFVVREHRSTPEGVYSGWAEKPVSATRGVAVDDQFLYWPTSDGGFWRVSKAGGAPARIASATNGTALANISVGAGRIEWLSQGVYHRTAITDGSDVAIDTGLVAATVFFRNSDDAWISGGRTSGPIAHVQLGTGAVAREWDGAECVDIVVKDDTIFCRTTDAVVRLPTGGPATIFATAHGSRMAVLDDVLYVDDNSRVLAVPMTGEPAMEVAKFTSTVLTFMAVGVGNLYLGEFYSAFRRAPLDGSASSLYKFESGFTTSTGIAADATGVYWVDQRTTCVHEIENRVPACAEWLEEARGIRAPVSF